MAAVKLQLRNPPARDAAPLWTLDEDGKYYRYLHEYPQLWVHVDYDNYRAAWEELGMHTDWNEPMVTSTFLDHVQNREAARLRGIYPYIRLMPVPSGVNSSAGHPAGGERMECKMLGDQGAPPGTSAVLFADPFDLTKMLRRKPGTKQQPGVRAFQHNFYEKK